MKPRSRTIALLLAVSIAAPAAIAQHSDPPEAEHTSRLQGMAYLGRHEPVVGATVLVQSQERPADLYLTSSDDSGTFRVDGLPDGLYRVRVEREGLAPRYMQDISVKYPFRAVVELKMTAAGGGAAGRPEAAPAPDEPGTFISVTGRIVEHEAGPLEAVRIRFVRRGGGDDPRYVRSAPDGSFALPAILAGEWHVEIDGVGLLAQRMDLVLSEDVDLTVIMIRQPPNYEQTPEELMPPEQPIPPAA